MISATKIPKGAKTPRLNWELVLSLVRENFSRNLSRLLEEKGRKAIELARWMDVSSATVNGWQTGRIAPKLDRLDRIADFFRVSYLELIRPEKGWDPPGSPPPRPLTEEELFRELAKSRGFDLVPRRN